MPDGQKLPNAPATPQRRGWCPAALTPMAAADGLLLRIRPPRGRLEAARLRALAALCRRHGSGEALLTRRGRIEVRGLREAGPAVAALQEAGLAPRDPAEERVPDILLAPAGDLDATAVCDMAPLAEALAAELRGDTGLHALPAKIAIVLDGGGRLHLGESFGDLRFDAVQAVQDDSGPAVRVALAGRARDAAVLGCCPASAVPAVAAALLRCFVSCAADEMPPPRRMAEALARFGLAPFQASVAKLVEPAAPPVARDSTPALGHLPGLGMAVAFPFGHLDAARMERLADAAERHGQGDIRILPTRSVLLAGAGPAARSDLLAAGGLDDPVDTRLRLAACSGLGACPVATTATRDDALALAARLPALLAGGDGCVLHVSGCAKGCAHSGPARVTLTGEDGRYDLGVLASPGAAPLWRGLTAADAARRLAALERVVERRRAAGETVDAALRRLGSARLRALSEEETALDEETQGG